MRTSELGCICECSWLRFSFQLHIGRGCTVFRMQSKSQNSQKKKCFFFNSWIGLKMWRRPTAPMTLSQRRRSRRLIWRTTVKSSSPLPISRIVPATLAKMSSKHFTLRRWWVLISTCHKLQQWIHHEIVDFRSMTSSRPLASWVTRRRSARSMQSGRQRTFTTVWRMAKHHTLAHWTVKKTSLRPTRMKTAVDLAGTCLQLLRTFRAHLQDSSRQFRQFRSHSRTSMQWISIQCRCLTLQRILSPSIPVALFLIIRILLKPRTITIHPSQHRPQRELLTK